MDELINPHLVTELRAIFNAAGPPSGRRFPEWLALESSGGEQIENDGEIVAHKPGNLDLLSNVVEGQPLARPRTILIDSAQLGSGEGMKADFKQAAGAELAAFKAEYRRRNPGADVEKITDDELLREVMNTVGNKSS